MTDRPSPELPRRDFLRVATGLTLSGALRPSELFAMVGEATPAASRLAEYQLVIDKAGFRVDGRSALSPMIDGSIPGPLLRLVEGQDVVLRVTNNMTEDTSIHWHGLLVPAGMDGVPGFSFDGIAPGETFTYRFRVRQAGTYWYHSHTGTQEQQGMYGALIIEPAAPDPVAFDREHVIVLSDWTDENPMTVLRNLKGDGAYYNYGKRTLPQFVAGVLDNAGPTIRDRTTWGRMRMDPTDIADVTGATYSYLMNGRSATDNWTALFSAGERVRLRLVNAAAMSYFDVRIPGLGMTVVQADGQDVEPVRVDEIRMGVAETYDVIVEPKADTAYTIFAQSMDRSGFARGTLAVREGVEAEVPPLDPRPRRTMSMMPMEGHDMGAMSPTGADAPDAMDHAAMGHASDTTGLRRLDYADLRALEPNPDTRPPTRSIVLRLTGDMERYFWTINDRKLSDSEPVRLTVGERIRLVFTNETMMEHPMHLHGVFMELQNGAHPAFAPRKHTINVPPNESIETHLTFEEPGHWACHCHLLFHMMTGMFARFEVSLAATDVE